MGELEAGVERGAADACFHHTPHGLSHIATPSTQAALELVGWAPKEFAEGASEEGEDPVPAADAAGAADATGGGGGGGAAGEEGAGGPEAGGDQGAQGASSSFVYDPNTGYYCDPASGTSLAGWVGWVWVWG